MTIFSNKPMKHVFSTPSNCGASQLWMMQQCLNKKNRLKLHNCSKSVIESASKNAMLGSCLNLINRQMFSEQGGALKVLRKCCDWDNV